MSEYIKRDDALQEVEYWADEFVECQCAIVPIIHSIQKLPAADVVPRQSGTWQTVRRMRGGYRRYTGIDDMGETHTITVDENLEEVSLKCSVCGLFTDSAYLNYCPNCGSYNGDDEHG